MGRTRTGMAVAAGALTAVLAPALLFAAPAAAASIGCEFDAGAERPTLRVLLKGALIVRMSAEGGAIEVADNTGTAIPCSGGSPTTANTDQINVKARGGQTQTVLVENPAAFAPGAAPEVLGTDEIEWKLALGRGNDGLTFLAGSGPDAITAGTAGVNANAGGLALGQDVDYVLNKVELLDFRGEGGSDEVSAAGGDATGAAWPRDVSFTDNGGGDDVYIGGNGDDHIAAGGNADSLNGGKGDDELIGATGNDAVFGEGGDDELSGNANADVISGGPGVDTARYGTLNGSMVTVDIGVGGANDGGAQDCAGTCDEVTGSVEDLSGEAEVDWFFGTDEANVLTGGPGPDRLYGRGGNDLLRAKDGAADTEIACGPGRRDRAKIDVGLDPPPNSC